MIINTSFKIVSGSHPDIIGIPLNTSGLMQVEEPDDYRRLLISNVVHTQDLIELDDLLGKCAQSGQMTRKLAVDLLYLAIMSDKKNEEVLLALFKKVGKVIRDHKDNFGQNFLHITAEYGRTQTFSQILKNGLVESVREKDNFGKTPLHYAAEKGHVEIVQTILKTDPEAAADKEAYGKTPLQLAEEICNSESSSLQMTANALKIINLFAELYQNRIFHILQFI